MGEGRKFVLDGTAEVHDVDHPVPLGHKPVGDEPAVAAPPEPLRAQEGHPLLLGQGNDPLHVSLEPFAEHVVREVPEALGTPSLVGGGLPQSRPAIAAQFLPQPHIGDPSRLQGLRKSLLGEVGIALGAREGPNIHEDLDAISGQEGKEIREAPGGMAYREKDARHT